MGLRLLNGEGGREEGGREGRREGRGRCPNERKKSKNVEIVLSWPAVHLRAPFGRFWKLARHLFFLPPSPSSPPPSELITARFNVEECLYAAAVCLYSQGEWQEAREVVDRLLRLNPDHRYGNELHLFVKDGQGREGGAGGREGGEGGYEGSR